METEKSNCCCDWKVAAITVGCVEFLLSIGLGIVFGAANLIIDDLFAAIVIILICIINVMASIIWLRGIALGEVRLLLTSFVWWMVSMVSWLCWIIFDIISGVELDGIICSLTVIILISHLSSALCFAILKPTMESEFVDRRVEIPDADLDLVP